MKITTESGKTFNVTWMWATSRGGSRLMIELTDERPLSQVAADFETAGTITKTDERAGVSEVYEGYTRLASVSRENADGAVRVTMLREG